jgi:hypothetical protein
VLLEFAEKGNLKAREQYASAVPRFYLTPRECKSALVRANWINKKYKDMVFRAGREAKIYKMPERAIVGWLNKRNDQGKWQRRFIVLHRGELHYFKDSKTSYPKGTLKMAGVRVDLPLKDVSHPPPRHTKCHWQRRN